MLKLTTFPAVINKFKEQQIIEDRLTERQDLVLAMMRTTQFQDDTNENVNTFSFIGFKHKLCVIQNVFGINVLKRSFLGFRGNSTELCLPSKSNNLRGNPVVWQPYSYSGICLGEETNYTNSRDFKFVEPRSKHMLTQSNLNHNGPYTF